MSNKQKHNSTSASRASTGCSRIKSYFSLCRPTARPAGDSQQRQEQQPASYSTPLLTSNSGTISLQQAYSEKVRKLELELTRLKKGISAEKRPAGINRSTVSREAQTYLNGELIRLVDGSYLHEIKKIGSPWKRLVMQVSHPLIVEEGSTATEAFRAMASMEVDDLYNCLIGSMPMGDIRGHDISKIQERDVMQGSEDGFTEAVLLGAIANIDGLVMEGLRIQMSSTTKGATDTRKIEKEKSKGCAVLIMLIMVRDPEESNEAVGELMVGLIEVSGAEMGEKKYHTEGVHVAGIKSATTRNGEEYYIWSTSVEGCKCVRNPDIPFTYQT